MMSLGQEMKSLQETLKQQQLSAEQNTVALFTVKCLSYIKHCLTQGILPKPIEIRANSLRNDEFVEEFVMASYLVLSQVFYDQEYFSKKSLCAARKMPVHLAQSYQSFIDQMKNEDITITVKHNHNHNGCGIDSWETIHFNF